jgi:hypothetical protein
MYHSFKKFEHLKIHLSKTFSYMTSQSVIPKGLSLKTPLNNWHSFRIVQHASKALPETGYVFIGMTKHPEYRDHKNLGYFLKSSAKNSDQHGSMT